MDEEFLKAIGGILRGRNAEDFLSDLGCIEDAASDTLAHINNSAVDYMEQAHAHFKLHHGKTDDDAGVMSFLIYTTALMRHTAAIGAMAQDLYGAEVISSASLNLIINALSSSARDGMQASRDQQTATATEASAALDSVVRKQSKPANSNKGKLRQ